MTWVSYAQNGEDVMLRRALADVAQGFYVDVGANDPRADSVTRAFYELGWHGINLEPVAHWFDLLQADRPRDLNLQLAAASREGRLRLHEIPGTGLSTSEDALAARYREQGREVRSIEVPARRLDDVLRDAGVTRVHFLKVDVEGAEAEVLRGLDLDRIRPWIVLVEATAPGTTAAAHAHWEPLLTDKDYEFVWFDGLNRFYLAAEHRERRAAFASPPNVFDDFIRYSEWLARRDVATLRRELEQARGAAVNGAGAALEQARVQAAQAAADAARAREEAVAARAALAEVLASRSWRAGAPLRWFGARARQLLRQRGAGREHLAAAPGDRPRLAFVSPLPPARTGVADYAARLLPELARHYEVELVVERADAVDAAIRARWPVRDCAWFEENAQRYDRRLYHFGNSLFHAHMFGLLARHPGTVALHDVVLSDLLDHLERNGDAQGVRHPHAFLRALYVSHGYPAIVHDVRQGRAATVRRYAASGGVVADAEGVIVHSAYAARELDAWYVCGDVVRVSALAREPLALDHRVAERAAARARLGLAEGDFLVCSFGVVAPSKLSHRLLDAWFGCALGADPRARLVFVGENDPGAYGVALRQRIDAHAAGSRVSFTGYASAQSYTDHLLATDLAVQLRTSTRGESSGAVVDCLAHGVPLVVNAHGPAGDLPGDCVALLADLFADAELAEALQTLHADEAAREALSRKGRAFVASVHSPQACARQYRDAIEHFALAGPDARRSRPGPRRLLVDITAVAVHDLRSGIQRVVRAVLGSLLERPPEGWRVEPVYQDAEGYRHARRFTLGLLGADAAALDDDPAQARAGDVFLGLDLVTDGVRHHRAVYERWRAQGASVHFVVYDLLPVLRPDWFPAEAVAHYRGWLDTVCTVSDGLVCISRSVRDELDAWLPAQEDTGADAGRQRPRLGWFHLGGDLEASLPSRGLSSDSHALLERIAAMPTFLMVGTVEPRKGHAQALAAFERLWARGVDCRLLVVGRAGWMVDALVARMRSHPEAGGRLVWLEDASDEMLALCYERSAALLLASEGEGFGLPLIEAARHRLPIIARDLPVFREVAGEFAWWFAGLRPEDLEQSLRAWLASRADTAPCGAGAAAVPHAAPAGVPQSAAMPWLGWDAATQSLLAEVLAHEAPAEPRAPLHGVPASRPHAPISVDVQGSP